jgi:beta-glucanase (GH16 family)
MSEPLEAQGELKLRSPKRRGRFFGFGWGESEGILWSMRLRKRFVMAAVIAAGLCVRPVGISGERAGDLKDWKLVWSDEFDLPNGSAPDARKWMAETGGNGWGNNELEYYTARRSNSRIEDGELVIEAIQEKYTGADGASREYTSARLKTQTLFSRTYGRFEARIQLPFGQGLWPAFWMLGDDIATTGWPGCGEIDIMENIGKEPEQIHGTIHGPGYSGGGGIGAAYKLASGNFSDDFHIFAVEWEPKEIRFYADGQLYQTRTPADLPAGKRWVYDHPFFIILNLAVGGGWPGNPNETTKFPQKMLVDYVRVYGRTAE